MTYPGAVSLKRWLKANHTTPHAFGLSLGVDPRKIRSLLQGKIQKVDTRLARAIEDATMGAVPMRDWS